MWRPTLIRAVLLCGFVACDGQLLKIELEQSSETTVPKGSPLNDLLGDFGFGEFTALDFTDAEELQNQGVEPGDISRVLLTRFDLTATSPSGADLSFIETMSVFVEAPDLPKVRIATLDDFPSGQDMVQFDLDEVDLVDYVVSQSMTITTEVSGTQPSDDTTVRADFTLQVGVTGKGACNYIQDGGAE